MSNLTGLIASNPLITFTLLLLTSLIVPPIFERIKLPGLVGLLFAGLCLGPDGLKLFNTDSETINLLSDIGKIYLMFVAGLEIDLDNFYKTRDRSLLFGLLTFAVPMVTGIAIGLAFNLTFLPSLLLGSLLASHTLLAYPILAQLGILHQESVTVSVGATIFTDIGALFVLAICVSINQGSFTISSLIVQILTLTVYTIVILLGFNRGGKLYFKRTGNDEGNQFLFVLITLFLAAVGAQLIHIDKIVGAFLAGLAINDVVGKGPLQEKVIFVGSTLFIPCFFIVMGVILEISGLVTSLTSNFFLTFSIVAGLIGSKFIAAWLAKIVYGYQWDECLTMWSLSLPQVAATLAAALVGVEAKVIDVSVFNAIIVLMLITSILGPIITAKFARRLSPLPQVHEAATKLSFDFPQPVAMDAPAMAVPDQVDKVFDPNIEKHGEEQQFTILIPLNNPYSQPYLIKMAGLLTSSQDDRLVALSIVKCHGQTKDPDLDHHIYQSQKLLQNTIKLSRELGLDNVEPLVRLDNDVALGISRAAKEQHAHLILTGWSEQNLKSRFFGSISDQLLWSAPCAIATMRLTEDPSNIKRILVPVSGLNRQDLQPVHLAQLIARAGTREITLIHVVHPKTPSSILHEFMMGLEAKIAPWREQVNIETVIYRSQDNVQTIIDLTRNFDLLMLSFMHRHTVGGIEVNNITTDIIAGCHCSLMVVGEPIYLTQVE
ncbi:MAG: universal stress protein [Synechococcaceae cyanobacterium RL_1_2]|nr:universal stress protein [Synechococcaceae cyanobacterium RL_1_2]